MKQQNVKATSHTSARQGHQTSRHSRHIRWDRVALAAVLLILLPIAIFEACNGSHPERKNTGVISSTDVEGEGEGITPATTTLSEADLPAVSSTTKTVIIYTNETGLEVPEHLSGVYADAESMYCTKLGRPVTAREFSILAMLVLSEAAYEPFQVQVSVAATVLNRVVYERQFKTTIEGVVTEPYQFSPLVLEYDKRKHKYTKTGFYRAGGTIKILWMDYPQEVRESVINAVISALDGNDPTEATVGGALYYCNFDQLSADERAIRENKIGPSVKWGQTTFYREWNP